MHKPYDVMAKGLVESVLSGPCDVRTEEEVVADARAIDTVVVPDPARVSELDGRGLLGRMGRRHCVIEAFHDPPSPEDADDCLLRVVALHARQRAAWKSKPLAERDVFPMRAVLMIVSAGSPDTVLREWALEPMPDWPSGCLWARSSLGPHVIVASELPRTRDTLMVRLMASGQTLREAWVDLRALPEGAWERRAVAPLLELLRRDTSRGWGCRCMLHRRRPWASIKKH